MHMNFIDWMARISRKKKKKIYSNYWKPCYIYFSLLAHSPTDEFIHPTKFESINRKTSKTAKAYYTA
jgi:hypothetical protein